MSEIIDFQSARAAARAHVPVPQIEYATVPARKRQAAGLENAFRFEGPLLGASSQTWTVASHGCGGHFFDAGPKPRCAWDHPYFKLHWELTASRRHISVGSANPAVRTRKHTRLCHAAPPSICSPFI
jgi:hypothetical protein